jgi:hypothetical protein
MKLGIMQPYIFPYIGYFQLIKLVDKFVIHDDVQWIKGGWINRNRILINGEAQYFTIPIRKGSNYLNINQREISPNFNAHKKKILRQIESAYKKAPYFEEVFSLTKRVFSNKETNISKFNVNALLECCDYLSIDTPVVFSSDLNKNNDLTGQDRVININIVLGSTNYINPIGGGMSLYSKKNFSDNGIVLNFLKTRNVTYRQYKNNDFVPFLSIIDVMMFNSREEISSLLGEYDLI